MTNRATEPTGPVRIGGRVLAESAALRIFGGSLEPDEISQLLGTRPTNSYRAGDPVSPRVPSRRKIGMWILESSLERSEPLSRHVVDVLSRLPSTLATWEQLRSRYSVDVYCSVDVVIPNSGMSLTHEAIEALSARGLGIEFDFYALPRADGS